MGESAIRFFTYLDKWKFFGLRKLYYILRKIFRFISYSFRPIKIIFDLRFIAKEEKEKILLKVINQLSGFKSILAIVDYGGKDYKPGISDVDWIVVVEERESDFLDSMETIKNLIKKYDYLFLHPPIIVEKHLLAPIVKNCLFCFYKEGFKAELEPVYKKRSFKYKKPLNFSMTQGLLGEIEQNFFYNLYIASFIKVNSNKRLGLRPILKTMKNKTLSLKIIIKLLSNNFRDTNHFIFIEKRLVEIIEMVTKNNNEKCKLDQGAILHLYKQVNLLIDQCLTKIMKLKKFSELEKICNFKNKVAIMNTSGGRVIFVKDYYKDKNKNIFIKFLKLYGTIFFDMRVFCYLKALENPGLTRRAVCKDGKIVLMPILKRASLLSSWRSFLGKNNLLDCTPAANIIIFNEMIKRRNALIDKFLETILGAFV